jgi:hypothetical protein
MTFASLLAGFLPTRLRRFHQSTSSADGSQQSFEVLCAWPAIAKVHRNAWHAGIDAKDEQLDVAVDAVKRLRAPDVDGIGRK